MYFSAFYYDRRGRGESTAQYAIEREIEDLDAVIDAAGGSAFVSATSSGGNLALRAAHGASMGKLALWEPNFIVNDGRPPLPADYVDHLKELVGRIAPATQSSTS